MAVWFYLNNLLLSRCVCGGGGGPRAHALYGVLALSVIVAFLIILLYRLNLGFCGYSSVHSNISA